jgi:hypothetical protein
MSNPTTEGSAARGVVDAHTAEHIGVRQLLAALCEATAPGDMARLLDAVDQMLAPHFAREEGPGGIFDTLLAANPGLHGTVREFNADHRRFMAELSDLRVAVRIDAEASRPRVRALCEDLSSHEAAENEAVAEALYSDIGTGD